MEKQALKMAEGFKPDMSKFDNGIEFNELYENGVKFIQVVYYDRTDGGYTGYTTSFNMDLEKLDELISAVDLYHEKLKEAQETLLLEVRESDRRGIRYNNRVGDSFGICHMRTFERDKEAERKEEEEREKMYGDYYDEPECSRCGDGGCVHCEPQYFM